MLAKKYRLPIQDFLGKKGKSVKSRYFLLRVFETPNGFSRLGAVISGKVAKKAVEQNRLKRQIFNFFREAQKGLLIADYLVIVFPEAAKLNKTELSVELIKILNPKS